MATQAERREALEKRLAELVLERGLGAASLRVLAAGAGTSDRMLLYYFQDKDALIAAVLTRIAGQMQEALDALSPQAPPRSPDQLLQELRTATRDARLRPFMAVWLEAAALASRGEQPYLAIAGGIADGFLQWTMERLEPNEPKALFRQAAAILARIDGAMLLDAIGRSDISDDAM